MRDPRLRNGIQLLYSRINVARVKMPLIDCTKPSENTELYVILNLNGTNEGSYYYVDHSARQIFWAEDVLLDQIMPVSIPRDSSFGTTPTYKCLSNLLHVSQSYPCCETITVTSKTFHATTHCPLMRLVFFAKL